MNCAGAEALFSDRVDAALAPAARAAHAAHLAGCPRCAAAFDEFRRAVEALQSLPTPSTSGPLRDAILAAVDADADRRQVAGRAWPIAVAGLGGAAAAALVAWLAWPTPPPVVAPTTSPPIRIAVAQVVHELSAGSTWTHAEAEFERDPDGTLRVTLPPRSPAAPSPTTTPAAAPLAWPKLLALPVPVPVPVPVPMPGERVLERTWTGPLLTIEADRLAPALERLGQQIGAGLAAVAAATDAARSPIARAARTPPRWTDPAPPRRAPVRISRRGDSVRLETSGSLAEIVPALLSNLDDADRQLTLVVERRLAAIHAAAEREPAVRDRLLPPPGEPGGTAQRGDPGDRRAGWHAWWAANRDLLIAAPAEAL